jgi:transcriptional regulator with XRE-family HTH domain
MTTEGGGLIRRARTELGITQARLATELGITHQTVADMETRGNPTIGLLARYGAAMGLELAVFYIASDGTIIE